MSGPGEREWVKIKSAFWVCVFCAVIVLYAGAGGNRGLPADAAPASVVPVYAVQETNPLREVDDEKIRNAVQIYYKKKKTSESFVDEYQNIHIYMKNGKAPDMKIAFVRYDMKIKDIYTPVPGLETVCIRIQGETILIEEAEISSEERTMVGIVAEHPDVQALFEKTEKAFVDAVLSDAILAESLQDLKKAAGAAGEPAAS